MRRNLDTIYTIICEMINQGYLEEHNPKNEKLLKVLIEDGFLIEPDFQSKKDVYCLTWKGHCFADLYDVWKQQKSDSTESLIAEIALKSFY